MSSPPYLSTLSVCLFSFFPWTVAWVPELQSCSRPSAMTVVDPIPLTYLSIIHFHKCTLTYTHIHTHSVKKNKKPLSDSRRHHFIWQEEGCRTSELGLFRGGEINILPSFPAPYPPPPALPEVRPDSPGTCLTWRWGQGVISSHKEDPTQHSWKQECPMRDFPLLERITDGEGVRFFILFYLIPL